MKPADFFYLAKAVLRRGPKFLYIYLKESFLFDFLNGTNTHLRVPKPKKDNKSNNESRDGLLYVASLTSVISNTLNCVQNQFGEKWFRNAQFIDLGCGKGKAVLVYCKQLAALGAPKAIGVEYDPKLLPIAQNNLKKLNIPKDRAEVFCDSATNFEKYIEDSPLIIYLYNSFQGETLIAVLDKLSKHEHVLIYVDPAEREILPKYNYTLIAENIGKYNADTWLVAVANRRLR